MPFSLRERTLNTKYRRNSSDKNIVPQYVENDFENIIIFLSVKDHHSIKTYTTYDGRKNSSLKSYKLRHISGWLQAFWMFYLMCSDLWKILDFKLGAVHKLCCLKIGDFWPPSPLLVVFLLTLDSGIDVAPWINVAPG